MPHAYQAVFGKWMSPTRGVVVGGEHQCTGCSPSLPEKIRELCRPRAATGKESGILNLDQGSWRNYPWLSSGGMVTHTACVDGEDWVIVSKQTGIPERDGGRYFHHSWFWVVRVEDWNWGYVPFLIRQKTDPLKSDEARPKVEPLGLVELPIIGSGEDFSFNDPELVERALRQFLPTPEPQRWIVSAPKECPLGEIFRRYFWPALCALPAGIRNYVSVALGVNTAEKMGEHFILKEGPLFSYEDAEQTAGWWLEEHVNWVKEEFSSVQNAGEICSEVDLRSDFSFRWGNLEKSSFAARLKDWDVIVREKAWVLRLEAFLARETESLHLPPMPLQATAASALYLLWGALENEFCESASFSELLENSLSWAPPKLEALSERPGHRFLIAILVQRASAKDEANQNLGGDQAVRDEAIETTIGGLESEMPDYLTPKTVLAVSRLSLNNSPLLRELAEGAITTSLQRSIKGSEGGNSFDDWVELLKQLPAHGWLWNWLVSHQTLILKQVYYRWSSSNQEIVRCLQRLAETRFPATIIFREPERGLKDTHRECEIVASLRDVCVPVNVAMDPAMAILDAAELPLPSLWNLIEKIEEARRNAEAEKMEVNPIYVQHPVRQSIENLVFLKDAAGFQEIASAGAVVRDLLGEDVLSMGLVALRQIQVQKLVEWFPTLKAPGNWLESLSAKYRETLVMLAENFSQEIFERPGDPNEKKKWESLAKVGSLLQQSCLKRPEDPRGNEMGLSHLRWFMGYNEQVLPKLNCQAARLLYCFGFALRNSPWRMKSLQAVTDFESRPTQDPWVFLLQTRLLGRKEWAPTICNPEMRAEFWKAYAHDTEFWKAWRTMPARFFKDNLVREDWMTICRLKHFFDNRPNGFHVMNHSMEPKLPQLSGEDREAFARLNAVAKIKLLAANVFSDRSWKPSEPLMVRVCEYSLIVESSEGSEDPGLVSVSICLHELKNLYKNGHWSIAEALRKRWLGVGSTNARHHIEHATNDAREAAQRLRG